VAAVSSSPRSPGGGVRLRSVTSSVTGTIIELALTQDWIGFGVVVGW
jgi:hypothetical protein